MHRSGAHLLLLASGCASLIHQQVWIRMAAGAFGSTTYALSTVLAVFFLGLALGSELFGRVAARARRPMRAYGILELALAATAAATPWTLAFAERLYGAAFRALPDSPGAAALARALLVAAALLPPAVLMGGTLPLCVRHAVRREGALGGGVALLYAANTVGAAIGCAAAGLWLVPQLGLRASVLVGAALQLAAGAAAIALRFEPAPPPESERRVPARRARLVGALALVAGLVALGQEVLWTRFVSLFLRHSSFATTLTLCAVLVGIVAGSLAVARRADVEGVGPRLLGALLAGAGLVPLVLMLPLAPLFERAADRPWIAFALLVPPAALSGACFPLAVRLTASGASRAAPATGRIAAMNTLGGILGALVTGFVLLPATGLRASALILSGLAVAAGCAAWILLDRELDRARRFGVAATALLLWLCLPALARARVPEDFLAEPGRLVAFREGLESNLAVVRADDGALQLEIDRWWQGRSRRTHQALAAHLPALLHPAPRRVLVVGVGVGQTAGRFLMHEVERLECVDLEPELFELVEEHFEADWLADPRVVTRLADGRQVLLHGTERWDLISIEVGQLFRPGAASLYTLDFYERVRERLAPDGIVAQFVPLDFLGLEALASVVATFRAVFPACSLWYNTAELVIVGSSADSFALPVERFAAALDDPRLAADLDYSHWGGRAERLSAPGALLGCFLAGPRGLTELAAGAPLLRDDRPWLEHASWRALEGELDEVEAVARLRAVAEDPATYATRALPAAEAERARELQRGNLAQLEARVHLRRVERAQRAGRPNELRDQLAAALAAQPREAETHRRMGDALLLEARVAEARPHFAEALAIRPEDARSRRRLAKVLQLLGRSDEAVPHYRTLLAQGEDDAELRFLLGMALLHGGDEGGAQVELREALRLEPEHADARRALERWAAD